MKTLEEIKDEYARERGFIGLLDMEDYGMIEARDVDEISKRYAKEVAREALTNASEEVTIRLDYEDYASSDWIDKRTIIDESNIPEL